MSVITLNSDNFKKEVLDCEKTVLVDFWASWCGPCRMLSPIVDAIAQERSDIKVGKVNVDDADALASEFSIMSIPTLIVFKNGKVVCQSSGVRPKEQILEMLK